MVTLRMGQSSGGGVRVCARTGLLVGGGVGCACVRARDSVCYDIRCSLPPILQLLILRQALDFALLKDWVGEDTRKEVGCFGC